MPFEVSKGDVGWKGTLEQYFALVPKGKDQISSGGSRKTNEGSRSSSANSKKSRSSLKSIDYVWDNKPLMQGARDSIVTIVVDNKVIDNIAFEPGLRIEAKPLFSNKGKGKATTASPSRDKNRPESSMAASERPESRASRAYSRQISGLERRPGSMHPSRGTSPASVRSAASTGDQSGNGAKAFSKQLSSAKVVPSVREAGKRKSSRHE